MSDTNEIFAAKYAARSIDTTDIVKFANDKLEAGKYSDFYLAILDDELKVWSTIAPLLEKAFEEKGVVIPEFEAAIWILVECHCRIIVEDCLSPRKQFSRMLSDIERFDLHKNISKYVGDNIGISSMYGWYCDDYSGIGEVDRGIVEGCENWLSEYEGKH